MSVYDTYEAPSGGGGLFFKFENDVENQVRIISEDPVVFESIFDPNGPKETISTKYGFIIINRKEDAAQIMQIPVTAFRKIQAFARDSEYGDPTQYDLRITRSGQGKDTEYNVVPGRTNSAPTASEQEAAGKIDLKATIAKGQNVQSVFYLSEATGGKQSVDGNKDTATMNEIVNGDDTDEVPDKPIDLSEIPF